MTFPLGDKARSQGSHSSEGQAASPAQGRTEKIRSLQRDGLHSLHISELDAK